MRKKTQDAGDGEPGTGDREWSRRGVFGALAGAVAVVAGLGRKRGETAVEKRRRKRLWIGHS